MAATRAIPLGHSVTHDAKKFVTKDNLERDVTLVSKPKPFYSQVDPFNIVKSAIRERELVLLDDTGNILASAPIAAQVLH